MLHIVERRGRAAYLSCRHVQGGSARAKRLVSGDRPYATRGAVGSGPGFVVSGAGVRAEVNEELELLVVAVVRCATQLLGLEARSQHSRTRLQLACNDRMPRPHRALQRRVPLLGHVASAAPIDTFVLS
eukprot:3250132-Rhodomonas_salina.4